MKNIVRNLQKLDATDQSVGRLATKIANLLRGKLKPEYQAHLDLGDIVEVSNISKLKFTGKKLAQKQYHHFTGYIGNLKTRKMSDIFSKDPGDVLRRAVHEMLPDNKLRAGMIKRLNIK
jgi:large subunit ribosomal protein L13